MSEKNLTTIPLNKIEEYVTYLKDAMSYVDILIHVEKELNKRGIIVEINLKENLTTQYFLN